MLCYHAFMNNEGRTISISTDTMIRAILLVSLVALLFFLKDLVLIIITAVVIASAIEPGILRLKKWHISRVPAVIIIYLSVAAVFIAIFYFVVPPFLDDAVNFLNTLPDKLTVIENTNLNNIIPSHFSQVNSLIPLKDVVESIRGFAAGASGGLFNVTSALFGGLLSFVLILVLSFYFAVQETGVDDFLRVITPLENQDHILNLWKRSQVKIGLWMQGQVILAIIVGLLTYLGLTILQVPYALLLAILIMVFEIIPVFGPILGATPAVIVAFTTGGVSLGLLTLGLYVIVQQFESHLIYPLVVRKIVGVPPLLVIIGLIVGLELFGFLGAILAVPVAAALREYINDINKAKDDKRAHQVV